MTRNYIGLSCSGHDNALAVVNSAGEVVFAEAAERYLQNKRALDASPDDMLRIAFLIDAHCEADTELVLCRTWSDAAPAAIKKSAADLDRVIVALQKSRSAARSTRAQMLAQFLLNRERSYLHLADLQRVATATAGRNLRYHFPERVTSVRSYDHHLTHAAAGCFTSPFTDAVCLVVDGMGEGLTVSCYAYLDGRLETLRQGVPANGQDVSGLGLFYADLCTLCGFDHWRGEEWKVMGLAAYGAYDARLHEIFRQCLTLNGLSFERPRGEVAALGRLWGGGAPASCESSAANLAYAGQRVFEELLVELCARAHELDVSDNLVLCGGCALNSSANGMLLRPTGFRQLYVPCAPADDGNAIGAALLGYYEDHPRARPRPRFQSPYLGSRMAREALERAALHSGYKHVERLGGEEMCEIVAARLCSGQVVGWIQGRAEFGPRALGNRSILADPRRPEMKDRINQAIKFREEFRPFAPAVLAEYADDYFDMYQEAPYMERTLSWRPEVRDKVPAVVHVDGTGRLQTVKYDWNPLFHRLLSAFHRRSGVPILINTSFNIMGKPIVHSVEDVMAVFATSGLDLLAIEDFLFAKV